MKSQVAVEVPMSPSAQGLEDINYNGHKRNQVSLGLGGRREREVGVQLYKAINIAYFPFLPPCFSFHGNYSEKKVYLCFWR